MKRNKIWYKISGAILFVLALVSCQKFADPAMVFEEEPEIVAQKARKVLIISVDGLSGPELAKDVPQNIKELLKNSKYTFEGMADANTGDASTWATLLSGKSSGKHGVHGNTFEEELDEDDPHGHNSSGSSTGFVTFFLRLLEQGKNLKSFAATSVADLDENVMSYADARILKTNDEEVKEAAVDTLKNSNVSFGVINFRSVNDAGVVGGFSMDNPAYKSAIDVVDGYIGEIKAALESRANFENEDWMVIVTANHAGIGDTYGGGTMEERGIPVIFYNSSFTPLEIEVPELMNSLTVDKAGDGIPAMVDPTAYEIGASGEFTILSKVLMVSSSGTNSVLYGKTSHAYGSTKGWHLMTQAADKKFRYIIGNGSLLYVISNETYDTNQWYSVVLKVYNDGDKRFAVIYQDGKVSSSPIDLTGKDMTAGSANTFFIGPGLAGKSYGVSSAKVNNLAFYDRALSDAEIDAYTCKQFLSEEDMQDPNLKGYWKLADGSGHILRNSITTTTNTNFEFTDASLPWTLGASWTCMTGKELEEYM
jgi:hypothetical protein